MHEVNKHRLERAGRFLPNQAILEHFIHHNPLHHLESLPFARAVQYARDLELYVSPGERAMALTGVDPRKRANVAVVELCSVFLDRGAAKWTAPGREAGFLAFFASLESLGVPSWRKYARGVAAQVRAAATSPGGTGTSAGITTSAEDVLAANLAHFGVPQADWKRAVLSMLQELHGWSGMFHHMEHSPRDAPAGTAVRLVDFAAVQSTLLRSSMTALAEESGWDARAESFADWIARASSVRGASDPEVDAVGAVSRIAYVDQVAELREQLEEDVLQSLLRSIASNTAAHAGAQVHATTATGVGADTHERGTTAATDLPRPTTQLYVCIDDREGSFRRHFEQAADDITGRLPAPAVSDGEQPEPRGSAETFGVAGFFGVPIRYRPLDGRDEMSLAPEGVQPTAVLIEKAGSACSHGDGSDASARADRADGDLEGLRYQRRRKVIAGMRQAWETASFSPLASLAVSSLFAPLSLTRLWLLGFAPETKQRVFDAVHRTLAPKPPTDFDAPFSTDEAATLLAATFRAVGTVSTERFAPTVFVLGHGSTSKNNPFAAAYNCGACAGRDGGANARLFARLANDVSVRNALRDSHGISIPDDTVFIGGLHNTTTDTVTYYDMDCVPESHAAVVAHTQQLLAVACQRNAEERCKRFMLAGSDASGPRALQHVHRRSVDAAEVRPELNHASNAAVVVGRRELTRGLSLDRRAFLPSYDPLTDDERGTCLESVLGPALVVSSGINLEYLFSCVAVNKYGAGTKGPLNVVGNIGVQQGASGDMMPGLPSQMTEMHTPVRLAYVVDAPVARVSAVLDRRPELHRLCHNDWLRLVVRDPHTGAFSCLRDGEFVPVDSEAAALRGNGSLPPALGDTADAGVGVLGRRVEGQRRHGLRVALHERYMYAASMAGVVAAVAGPIASSNFGVDCMNPHGAAIAVAGGLLTAPILAFSRRYLHGEHMFARFSALSVGLLAGFNIVATAPDLVHVLGGWSLFGFASTFLIGSYNERPTVRNHATFAFAAYRISDFALITSAAFASTAAAAVATGSGNGAVAAGGVLLAALFKSSQFPLTGLFSRSMEGPTPTSALGYAGLSAHVGVVLLAGTTALWFPHDAARIALGAVGLYTAAHASLISKVCADRKGALAYATSASLGLIMATMAAGYSEAALLMSFGHAAFRINQILLAPNFINDSTTLRAALGRTHYPRVVPDALYRAAWALRRLDSDVHFLHELHRLSRAVKLRPHTWKLSLSQQWALTAAGVAAAGAPFTPLSHALEHTLIALLPAHPVVGAAMMLGHFGASVLITRALFVNVLSSRRFRKGNPPLARGTTNAPQ